MLQIIREVREIFEAFIEDEEQKVMVVEDTLEESPLLLKVLGIIEESETSNDIFLSFGDEFQDTRRYVETIIERQKEQIELLNLELQKRNLPLLAEIDQELLKRNKPSQARLEGIFRHIRQNVEPERRVIWVFHPLAEIEQENFYADLWISLAGFLFSEEIAFTKIIVRETPSRLLSQRFAENAQVCFYRPQLSREAIFKKIEESAESKEVPPDEKAQSLMMMAGIDIAEKRYDQALRRNQQVLAYFKKSNQRPQQSIVQNNIGDVFYIQGKYQEAQTEYEKAILLAVEEKSQPLVMYQSINLGNALFMQEKYEESLIYYDSAEKLAEVNHSLPQRIQAIERMGEVKKSQEKFEEAIEIWSKGAEICRQNKYKLGLLGILEKLEAVFEIKEEDEKLRQCRSELEKCREDLRAIDPHLA